jgi:hypothetical protein
MSADIHAVKPHHNDRFRDFTLCGRLLPENLPPEAGPELIGFARYPAEDKCDACRHDLEALETNGASVEEYCAPRLGV